ncbi:carotenoid oxygenase family protein [Dokdonella sp.]|uniref:carotenoid oxygenase family protein n=1 Tax=Dokdonella sp. TaxID=2291710 RepID=UPI001B25928F|nr:carotenoid oxygenase family protein [Dokdonella sp.]MBO9661516.1 carotenoid oxygenase family protein [Dokdonella sp.]
MNRRRFLGQFLAGTAAFALAPRLLRAEVAVADDSRRFAQALAREPWLAGWNSVAAESLGPSVATIEGRWPKDLVGTLYRNGPALFDRAGLRYRHWFDGDGMLHAWRFAGGRVEHRARMVATSKYTREQSAGRFLLPAAGTTIPDAVPIRNNDDLNTANTAVIRFGGRLFALWEGGSAIELDPADLRTLGPVTWREDLVAAPFSAHPLLDRDGSLWNFGSLDLLGGSGLLLWHIGADGKTLRTALLPNERRGYLHAFAMTDRHLVFVLTPYRIADRDAAAFFERLQFAPDQPCRIAVVPKDALDAPRWFEAEFGAVYHFADAHERAGEILVQAVRHTDPDDMRSPMAAAMRGERGGGARTELALLRIDPAKGTARWEARGVHGLEFPVFDHRHEAAKPARVFAPLRIEPAASPYFNAVAAIDGGRRRVHRYGADVLAEEHVFVPKPGRRRVGQGWLLGTLLDARRGRSGLAVLDAERIEDGPLAQAWLPHTFPLGFHGWFAAG